jgi:hypothetical protein
VSDFALALESASAGAISTAVGRPQILARPANSPDAAPSRTTTFTQSTGELDDALAVPRTWPKWILATGAALVLLLAAFLLFRPGPAPKPVIASPAPVASAPPVPVAPALPPQAEPPAAVAPNVRETKPEPPAAAPEPKAKTSHSADGVRRKKQRPAKEPSEENQDIWRVE